MSQKNTKILTAGSVILSIVVVILLGVVTIKGQLQKIEVFREADADAVALAKGVRNYYKDYGKIPDQNRTFSQDEFVSLGYISPDDSSLSYKPDWFYLISGESGHIKAKNCDFSIFLSRTGIGDIVTEKVYCFYL